MKILSILQALVLTGLSTNAFSLTIENKFQDMQCNTYAYPTKLMTVGTIYYLDRDADGKRYTQIVCDNLFSDPSRATREDEAPNFSSSEKVQKNSSLGLTLLKALGSLSNLSFGLEKKNAYEESIELQGIKAWALAPEYSVMDASALEIRADNACLTRIEILKSNHRDIFKALNMITRSVSAESMSVSRKPLEDQENKSSANGGMEISGVAKLTFAFGTTKAETDQLQAENYFICGNRKSISKFDLKKLVGANDGINSNIQLTDAKPLEESDSQRIQPTSMFDDRYNQ